MSLGDLANLAGVVAPAVTTALASGKPSYQYIRLQWVLTVCSARIIYTAVQDIKVYKVRISKAHPWLRLTLISNRSNNATN